MAQIHGTITSYRNYAGGDYIMIYVFDVYETICTKVRYTVEAQSLQAARDKAENGDTIDEETNDTGEVTDRTIDVQIVT